MRNRETTAHVDPSGSRTRCDFSSVSTNSRACVGIVHHNVQSMGNCLDELEAWVNTAVMCDLLCLTEHWRSTEELALIKVRNFSLISGVCRDPGKHGGAAVFARESVNAKVRVDLNNLTTLHEFECAGAEVLIAGQPWIVAAIYRTDSGRDVFFDKMNTLLDICFKENKQFLICGDFNIDLKRCSREMLDFVELINSFNAVFTINDYTRITSRTKTCIDNIIVPAGVQFTSSIVHPGYSDHTAQVVELSVGRCDAQRSGVRRRYSDHDIAVFLSDLRSASWQAVYDAEGVDNKWDTFARIFAACFEANFPLRRCRLDVGGKGTPWITPQISEMRERVSLLQLISKHDERYRRYYDAYRGVYNTALNQAKNQFYMQEINNSDNRSKATWKVVNSFLERAGHKQVLPDGDPAGLANEFNDYFCTVASNLASNIPRDSQHDGPGVARNVRSFFLEPVTQEEILQICKSLKNSRSFGHDNVPVFILKLCIDAVLAPVCHIINDSFVNGKYPQLLKVAEIIPFYKKGDSQNLNSYRAISLQSSFSKLIERAMYNRLLKFFTKYNLISPSQHGFLPGKGTDTALFHIIRDLSSLIERDSAAYGVFLDLSKAFDCLDHGALVGKLENCGIRGVPLEWLKSYLGQRRQLVRVGVTGQPTVKSDIRSSKDIGVPQGTILGPLLFVIYVNDFNQSIGAFETSLVNYADDASIISPYMGGSLGADLEAVVDSVHFWLRANRLLLNIDKTKCIMFTTNRSTLVAAPGLAFSAGSIDFVESSSVLGVLLDDKLSFREHIQRVANRLSKSSYGIRIIARNTSRPTIFTAYYGLIYPILRYGIVVWGGSTEMERVFVAQKKILRIMLHLSSRHSCRGLFKNNSLLTAYGVYIFECLIFVRKHEGEFTNFRRIHNYPTRQTADLVYPSHRYTHTERLPHYAMLRLYNKVPLNLRSLKSDSRYKRQIFRYICDIEPYTIREFFEAG